MKSHIYDVLLPFCLASEFPFSSNFFVFFSFPPRNTVSTGPKLALENETTIWKKEAYSGRWVKIQETKCRGKNNNKLKSVNRRAFFRMKKGAVLGSISTLLHTHVSSIMAFM